MAAFLVFPAISGAAIISGNINGAGVLTLTNGLVTFSNAGVGLGSFVVDVTSTGSFVPLIGKAATVQPLNQVTEPTGPVGTFAPVPNFITFAGSPISVTLTAVDPATLPATNCLTPAASAAAGQVCGTGPFNLFNLSPTRSSDSFGIQGTVSDGSASPASTLTGVFTAQFSDKSFEAVRDTVLAGGSVTTSYSASFTASAVPEPATLSFMGLGLLAIAAGVRRRARQ